MPFCQDIDSVVQACQVHITHVRNTGLIGDILSNTWYFLWTKSSCSFFSRLLEWLSTRACFRSSCEANRAPSQLTNLEKNTGLLVVDSFKALAALFLVQQPYGVCFILHFRLILLNSRSFLDIF